MVTTTVVTTMSMPFTFKPTCLPFLFMGVGGMHMMGSSTDMPVVWFLGPPVKLHHIICDYAEEILSLKHLLTALAHSTAHCLWGSIWLKTCSTWHVRQTDTYSRLIIIMALILLWAPQPSILLRWWGRLHFPRSGGFLSWTIFIPVPVITSTLWPGKQGTAVSSWLTWIWVTEVYRYTDT